jgi:hypothetical protein
VKYQNIPKGGGQDSYKSDYFLFFVRIFEVFADFALAEHIYAETSVDESWAKKCMERTGSILFRKYVSLKSSDIVLVVIFRK